ncbi:hypothetical protein KSS87_000430 [Heliosperma pusillum]|nr:hypothetical protein KSS87_000430 [Heliosperma pusillum]
MDMGFRSTSKLICILMIKRELAKDPDLANENWDRFLPKYKKKNVKTIKKANAKEKKPYTPFPSPQQPSKKKSAKVWQEKQEKQAEKTTESKRKRDAAFIPPEEPVIQNPNKVNNDQGDVNAIAKSLKEKVKDIGQKKSLKNADPQDYIANTEAPTKKKHKRSKS